MFHRVKTAGVLGGFFAALCFCSAAQGGDVTLKTSVTTGASYDSNIYSRGQSQDPEEDYVVQLVPQIEILDASRAMTVSLKYAPSGYYYLKNPQLNSVDHFASAALQAQLSRKSTFGASESVRYTKESREASMTGIQTKRMRILTNTAALNATHEFTPSFSASANASDTVLKFEDPNSIDSRTDTAGVTGVFKATENTALTAGYTYTRFSFSSAPGDTHSNTHTVSLGLKSRVSESFDVNLSGGMTRSPSASKKNDWVAAVDLSKTFRAGSVDIGYSRSVTNTAGLTDLLNVNNRYSIGLTHSLTGSTDIGVHGIYSDNRTNPGVLHLTSYEAGVNASWHAYSWMTVSAVYSHFQQWDNSSPGDDIRKDLVTLNVTATMSEWRF